MKVLKKRNYSQRFELLYDFTAGIGDSWTIGELGTTLGYDSIVVTVDSVSTMTVNGQIRKIQFISSPQFLFFDWGRTIMEGVGELSFMAPDWGLYEDSGCGLRCFNDGTNDLRFVPYPCDAIVSVHHTPDGVASITASPDPTSGQVTVNNLPPNAILRLFDALGRRINLPTITGTRIDLGHCSSGIYILRFGTERGC